MRPGLKIKFCRMEAGLSQVELAKKIGRSVTGLSKIENGKLKPSLDTLQLISKVLNISLDELARDLPLRKAQ